MPVEGIEAVSRRRGDLWVRRYQSGWTDLQLVVDEEWTTLSEYDPRPDVDATIGVRWPTYMTPSMASTLREVFTGPPEIDLSDPDDEGSGLHMVVMQHLAQIEGRGRWALKMPLGAPPQLWLAIGVDIMLLANDEGIGDLPTRIVRSEDGLEQLLSTLS